MCSSAWLYVLLHGFNNRDHSVCDWGYPYRKYEQLRLHSLEYQLTSARKHWEENQDIEGSERETTKKKKEETEREQMEWLNQEYNGLDCTTLISCRSWGWTSYHCTFPTTRSPSKGRKLKRSQWSKCTLTACCTILWSVNNLGTPVKKCATTSDLITFRGLNWLAKWCGRSSHRFKLE